MKAVQVGILVLLFVIAGLLGTVVYQRSAENVADAAIPELTPIEEPLAEVAPPAPEPEPPKPQPAPTPPRSKPAPARAAAALPPPKPASASIAIEAPAPPKIAPDHAGLLAREPSRILKPDTATAPPPPAPRKVTVPAGYEVNVRLISTISTNRHQAGDSFSASLNEPLVIDGLAIAEKNARVEGRVIDSQKGGRIKGRSAISLELVRLHTEDGQQIEISTSTHSREAESTAKSDAKKVGIMTGIGAVVGAIAGGGKGAAIGAGVGAGAGGGTVAATRGDAVVIPSETELVFRLAESVVIVEKQ